MTRKIVLMLGGVRSGKSRHAVKMAASSGEKVLFVATAQARDEEMRARIEAHQAERDASWLTLEAPMHLGEEIRKTCDENIGVVLIDCMSLLVTNVMMSLPEDADERSINEVLEAELKGITDCYAQTDAAWIIVSNEVGMGVVPAYPVGRLFRDVIGRFNQRLAEIADEVYWMVAGIPVHIK